MRLRGLGAGQNAGLGRIGLHLGIKRGLNPRRLQGDLRALDKPRCQHPLIGHDQDPLSDLRAHDIAELGETALSEPDALRGVETERGHGRLIGWDGRTIVENAP